METGCYVAGHEGWHGVLSVIGMAEDHGFEVDDDDREHLAKFERGEDDEGYTYEIGDDAEQYLNDKVASEGFSFGWHDGEFFYWADET